MAKLIYSAICSLDEYVEDEAGKFDWAAPDEEVLAFVNELERPVGTYLYGRRMYDTLVYWETADDGPEVIAPVREWKQIWLAADKIVYSRSLAEVRSARTRIEREFDPDAIRRMKHESEADITVGGAELAGQALAVGLVDELQLFLNPVIVGGGKRTLPDGLQVGLELIDEHRFAGGVVYLSYRVGYALRVERIAFLGTGTMGAPMVRNLAQAGFEIHAWNRSGDRAQALEAEGVGVFEDAWDAARGCDGVITMLSDAAAVLDTAAPALEALENDGIWLQMSTIGIEGIERCEKLAAERGVTLVDAPVLGTREPAEEGKLVVLASGDAAALERCDGVFDAVGSRTLRFDQVGHGTRCKLVVNSWVLGVTALVAETVSLAEALGIDPERFFDAVEGGALDLPYARLKGGAMIERAFDDPAFRLTLACKDADLVLAAAEEGHLDVPVLRAVSDRLNRAEHKGHGEQDMAANYLATANGHTR